MNDKPLNISKAEKKEELVRLLVKLRLRSDFEANKKGITEDIVDSFSDDEVDALPEYTLVHIVDAYVIMHKKGVPDAEIFKKIELQRSLLEQGSSVPEGVNLTKYILWRIKNEFPQIASLEEMVINMEMLYAITWFSRTSKNPLSWAKADVFASKVFKSLEEKHLEKYPAPEAQEEPEQETEDDVQVEEAEMESQPTDKGTSWLGVALITTVCVSAAAYWLFAMGGIEAVLGMLSEADSK